jgi:hypothetical protein
MRAMRSHVASRLPLLFAVALATTSASARADERDQLFDGVVVDAAAIPKPGTLRFSAIGGGGELGRNASDSAYGAVGGLYSFGTQTQRFAAIVQGVFDPGTREKYHLGSGIGPSLALHWQFMSQERTGTNLGVSMRYKAIGFNAGSSELELGFNAGRTFGNFSLVGNAVVGKEVNDGGADLEVRAGGLYNLAAALSVGFEGRLRSGIEPDAVIATVRSYDLVVGPTVALNLGPIRFQGIVGYGMPRYQVSGGAFGLLSMAADVMD